jgi:hypothetical protein
MSARFLPTRLASRLRRPSPYELLAVVLGAAALGGVAYAAIPSSSGVFTGCYATTNGTVLNIPHSKGDLRLVEPNEACRNYERRVTWNEEGPPGEPGESATDLWAVINPDGSVAAGSHVVAGGGTTKAGTGNYLVQFDRNISGCASVASAHAQDIQADGVAVLRNRPSQSQVQIFTEDLSTGQNVDSTLHVAIFC